MIKQQQRVIKKGDYYEMQTYEETMMLISKGKKQDQQNSTANIVVNDYIVTEIPGWNSVRASYFSSALNKEFQNKGLDELMEELTKIAKDEHMLTDEDRNQIEMLIQQISSFANCQQVQLNSLPPKAQQPAKAPHPQHTSINLTARYNLSQLQSRIQTISSLEFPDLISLQHQLQIMLGEKKPLQSLQLSQMDQKEKEEMNNLYNHLNSLTIMNNTQRVIDDVFVNESKHVEMDRWVEKMQKVQEVNADLLAELKQDKQIVDKIEGNFGQNVKKVREILGEIRGKQQ